MRRILNMYLHDLEKLKVEKMIDFLFSIMNKNLIFKL